MSVRVGKDITRGLVVGLVGMLMFFGGCEDSQRTQASAEIDIYRQISDLEQKRQGLEEKIQKQKDEIRALAEEHGAGHLDTRLAIQVQQVAAVVEEVVEMEAARTKLEVEVEVLSSLSSKTADQEKRLEEAKIELQMARTSESRMRDILAKEDAEAVELGRRQIAINDLKEQILADQRELEKVKLRIAELESEKTPAKRWPW